MNLGKRPSNRRHRVRSMFGAVLIAGISLGSGMGTIAGAATAQPKDLANILFGGATLNINVLPIWTAQNEGYFTKHGLAVKYVQLTSTTAAAALVSNSVQFIDFASPLLVNAIAAGVPVEGISQFANGNNSALEVSAAFASQFGITKTTPLKTIAQDLTGQTCGYSSTSTLGALYVWMRSYGVNPGVVKQVQFASVPALIGAFSKNSVQCWVGSPPNPQQSQALSLGPVVATAKNSPAWAGKYLNVVTTASDSYAKSNPGITKEFVAAVNEATVFIHNHEQQNVTSAQQNLANVSRPILLKGIQATTWPTTEKFNVNIWRSTIAYLVKSGQEPPGTKVVENIAWTNAYATK